MSLPLETLSRLVDQCDPNRPLDPGSPLYIPMDADPPVRGHKSCVETLRRTILLARGRESCQLFTGFPGTGKTTELRRLAAQLHDAAQPAVHTIFIDFETYIDLFTPPTITDILRILAYCLDREATRAEGKDPDSTPGYSKQIFNYLQKTAPELKELGFEAFGGSLMLEFKNNPSFRQRADEAMQSRFQKFAQEAQATMTDAVIRIRRAIGSKADRLVVIADGLEKFRPIRENDRTTMESAVETIFLSHHDLLRIPCHVIYTFPVWLRFRSQLGAGYSREPLILPMIKIREQDGTPSAAGIEKLSKLVQRRLVPEDPAAIFGANPEDLLRPLIAASGGYPRDLLRMVRTVLTDSPTFPVSAEDVAQVIRDLRRSYHDMVLGTYVPVLAQVAGTHALPNADASQLAMFGYLFERFLIFAYRNGEEWFDVHPLIRDAPSLLKGYLGASP
jgi:hypothetical protein